MPFGKRVGEAYRLITGKQRTPSYRMDHLAGIIDHVLKRERSRLGIRNYDSASTDRRRADFSTSTDTPYAEISTKHATLRARSRNLYKTDSTYRGTINQLVNNIIGTGLWPKPKVRDAKGELREDVNKALEKGFWIYSSSKHWDARKKYPFIGEGQRLLFRTLILSGDVFLNAVKARPGSYLPISWQIFESDRLDTSTDMLKQNYYYSEPVAQTLHGINLDEYGAPVSYWLQGINKPIPAKNIIHSFPSERPEQYIGVPVGAPVLDDCFDNHDLKEDYILKSRAIAKVLWFLSNENADNPHSDDLDTDDFLELPEMSQMRGDKAPEQMKMPDSVSDTIQPLLKMGKHDVTSAMGTAYATVTRDLDGVNFAGAKFIDNLEWRSNVCSRDFFLGDCCGPFYEKYVQQEVIAGRVPGVTISQFMAEPWAFAECQWVGVGKQDVDPLKEINAEIAGIGAGVLSLGDVVSKRGKDLDDHLDELAEERKKIEKRGLKLNIKSDRSAGEREPGDSSTTPEEEANDEIDRILISLND